MDKLRKIVIYGADWCPYCQKVEKFFKKEGIKYSSIDV